MGKKVIALILALVLPVFLLAGCGAQKETSAGSGNVIKVGFAGPLSGASGQVGASCYNGALMAFNERKAELEEKSGCTLEFVTNDDQSDPTVAVTIGQKMVSDPDVLIMIGHCNSSCTISSSAITCPAELGMVTGQSTNVDVTDRGLKGILRVCQRDDFEAPATARFCKDSLGIQTIFLVNDQQAFGAGQCEAFAAEAAQIGLDVVANEGIVSNEVDFSAVVNQIAAADHFQQLQDDAFRQRRILRFAREEQLRAAQGDSDSALLLHQRNILVVQPEQGHIGIHRIQRQGNLSRFSQKRCPSFHLKRRQSSSY